MKKNIYKILLPIVTAMLLLLSSCNSIFDDYPKSEEATILLSIDGVKTSTRAGTLFANDEAIEKLRVIVFKSNGEREENKLFITGADEFNNPFRVKTTTGTKNVYVIANETVNLENIQDETSLKSHMLNDINSELEAPLVMTGEIQNITLIAGLQNNNVTLKRVAAKINISFMKATTDNIQITKVSLLSNTSKSTLWQGATLSEAQSYWNHVVSNPMSLTNSFQNYFTTYLYENLGNSISNKANATMLEIDALYNNIPTRYRVYVNEEVVSNYSNVPGNPSSSDLDLIDSPYNIKRNYNYNITGTIVSMGEFDGLLLSTNVLPWEYIPSSLRYEYNFNISPQPTQAEREYTLGDTSTFVEFTFTLTNPINTTWIAQLSNPIDFEFIGTSVGITGETVTLTIKPKHTPDTSEERSTEFYFTANNAEIPIINGSSLVGSGNRVIIKQPAMP